MSYEIKLVQQQGKLIADRFRNRVPQCYSSGYRISAAQYVQGYRPSLRFIGFQQDILAGPGND